MNKTLTTRLALFLSMGMACLASQAQGAEVTGLSADERVGGVDTIRQEAMRRWPLRDRLTAFEQQVRLARADVAEPLGIAQYYARLERLVATLEDGHTFVLPPPGAAHERSKPSVGVEMIGGAPTVTWVRNDLVAATPLGSRVIEVDGQPIAVAAADKRGRVFASTKHVRDDQAISRSFEGARGTRVTVSYVTPAGERRQQAFERGDAWPEGTYLVLLQPWQRQRIDFQSMDEGRIAYFAARDFRDQSIHEAFVSHLPAMQRARVVIVDVRKNSGGQSSVGHALLSHFLAAPVLEGRSRAVAPASDRENDRASALPEISVTMADLPRATIDPVPPTQRISAHLIVLTDHQTVSAAEDFVSVARLVGAVQVGETTAGSTGEMTRIALPGGGTLFMLSKWDQAASGEEFVGRGFVPEVQVVPAVEVLIAGEDPVLQAALQVARTRWASAPPGLRR